LRLNVSARLSRPVLAPFALLPKDLPHRFQNLSDQAGRVLCVQSRGGVEEFFERINVLSEKAASPDPKKIRELAENTGSNFFQRRAGSSPRLGQPGEFLHFSGVFFHRGRILHLGVT
jgi:hypothetical protein